MYSTILFSTEFFCLIVFKQHNLVVLFASASHAQSSPIPRVLPQFVQTESRKYVHAEEQRKTLQPALRTCRQTREGMYLDGDAMKAMDTSTAKWIFWAAYDVKRQSSTLVCYIGRTF